MSQRIHLLIYGSGRYEEAKKRLAEEAKQTNVFDEIHLFGVENMYNDYKKALEKTDFDYSIVRGYPRIYLIFKLLRKIDENHILFYLDAGFVILSENIKRLSEYIKFVNSHKPGILTMQLSGCNNEFIERKWTNSSIFKLLEIPLDDKKIAMTNQLQSGFIMIKNSREIRNFIFRLKKFIDNDPNLITNKYDNIDPHTDFIAGRREQSLLSMMLKKEYPIENISILNETYPIELCKENNYPFYAARNRSGI
jgi:hypothetical protein